MSTKRILVLGDPSYDRPFVDHGVITHDPTSLPECSVVVFTGGTDVNPKRYNEKRHPTVGYVDDPRDDLEFDIYSRARKMNIPMVGICRGAQLLHVANGGTLIQHCDNHGSSHKIKRRGLLWEKKDDIGVTSSHHQMLYMRGMSTDKYNLLAWAEGLSTHRYKGTGENITGPSVMEPEVVWFRDTKSLAVQYHPEWMQDESEGYKYFQELLEELVIK